MAARIAFHRLRIVASFALLGAVVVGTFFHGIHFPVDPRACGAAIGAAFATLKVCHVF